MSTRKVRRVTQSLGYVATWATGVLTVTTEASHNLKTGDVVTFLFNNSPQELANVAVTVTDVDEFTIPLANTGMVQNYGIISIPYFSAGQTGVVATFSIAKSIEVPTIVQMTAQGAGGAALVLSVSNDGIGWVEVATVTLASSNLATDFVSIAPNWSQAKLTATSIGAATNVVVTVTA